MTDEEFWGFARPESPRPPSQLDVLLVTIASAILGVVGGLYVSVFLR